MQMCVFKCFPIKLENNFEILAPFQDGPTQLHDWTKQVNRMYSSCKPKFSRQTYMLTALYILDDYPIRIKIIEICIFCNIPHLAL